MGAAATIRPAGAMTAGTVRMTNSPPGVVALVVEIQATAMIMKRETPALVAVMVSVMVKAEYCLAILTILTILLIILLMMRAGTVAAAIPALAITPAPVVLLPGAMGAMGTIQTPAEMAVVVAAAFLLMSMLIYAVKTQTLSYVKLPVVFLAIALKCSPHPWG